MFKFLKTYETLFPTSEIIPLPSLIDVSIGLPNVRSLQNVQVESKK